MPYPARFAHPAGGYYHLWLVISIEPHRLLTGPRELEVLEIQRIVTFHYVCLGLIVEYLRILLEDLGGCRCHRTVHIHHYVFKVLVVLTVAVIHSVEFIYQLLRPAYRKGRYNGSAASLRSFPYYIHELFDVHGIFRMEPVAVCSLHYHIICFLDYGRISQYRSVHHSQVT